MSKKFFLSVLAMFKNEAHILDEWISTHIDEGVEHFYLINNDSNDNYIDIIKKYSIYTTLFNIHGNGKQNEGYNLYKNKIINETEWLITIDLDEFVFSTINNTRLIDYVKKYDSNNANGIYLPWIMYGSSNFKKQPDNVKQNFIYRKKAPECEGGKCIVKTSHIKSDIRTHLTPILDYSTYVNYNGEFNSNEWFGICPNMKMSEDIIKSMKIRINHYPIQSEEFFLKIKCTRGDGEDISKNNFRDKNYFKAYDNNEIKDDCLAKKLYSI